MDKVYWNIIPFLLNSLSKFLHVSWLNWPLPYSFIEHVPNVLDWRHVSRQCWPRKQRDTVLDKVIHVCASDMGTGIVLLKDEICPRMCVDVWQDYWTQDLIPISLCVQVTVYDHQVKFLIEMDASPNHHTSPTVRISINQFAICTCKL